MTDPRPPWGGRRAQALTRAVLARDYDDTLGYTPCRWCGGPATSFDHWPIARIEGGPDDLDNGVSSCLPCNTSRGVKLWQERKAPPEPSRRW